MDPGRPRGTDNRSLKAYYQDDLVTIYHGDCRDVLPTLRADAVISDPPYGVGKVYGDAYTDDGGPEYWDWMRETVAACRVAAPVVAMTHRVYALRELTDWEWVGAWTKRNQQSRLWWAPILPAWEPVLLWGVKNTFGANGQIPTDRYRSDVFQLDAIPSNLIPGGHPFPKPVDLMEHMISWLTRAGQTVLDPFAGSGTTLAAAKILNRRAIGIEIEERYCEIAAQRCSQEVLGLVG